jgi:hypothetical protein
MSKKQKKVVVERDTNKTFSITDEVFKKACEAAGVQNTVRQASKFRMGKGSAYKHKGGKNG